MNSLEVAAIFVAGVAAGTINAVVGSGTLVTFPVLLAFGFPPVVANVSNTIGLVFGNLSGVYGYRRELVGQRDRIYRFSAVSLLGGLTGAALLLVLPQAVFKTIVPVLIALALLLVVFQPRLSKALAVRQPSGGDQAGFGVLLAVYGCAIYGGYFGAAQGVLMISVLSLGLSDTLQRVNGLKNVLVAIVNLVAGVLFIITSTVAPTAEKHVDWPAAGLIAVGSILGGQLGAYIGRRLSPIALRAVIVCVGIVAIAKLVTS